MHGDLKSDHATIQGCIHLKHAPRAVVITAHRTILARVVSSSDWIATIEADDCLGGGLVCKGLNV
jgi:hypothetical protein